MKATQDMINANRTIIQQLREHQTVFIQYGTEWNGLATIKQVQHKQGKGGDTSLLIRFYNSEKFLTLSWRDENLLAIKPLELEEIQAYFTQTSRT